MKILSLLFFFFLLPTTSSGAEPKQEETLEPLVVTATRLKDVEEEISKIPRKVVVITNDEIEKLGAKTVQEVLQYQSGVVLYDLIGNEFQSTFDLRGFNGQPVPGTTVFVDGVRVNEPDFNTINFDLLPIESIEKIEILYGPGTVFGRNALAGVINIITKKGHKDRLHVSAETGGGSYGRQRYTFITDGPLPMNDLSYYFAATRELSGGYRQDSAGRITRIFTKLGYSNNSSTDIDFSYTHVDDKLKQAGSLTPEELDRNRRDNATPGDSQDGDLNLVSVNLKQRLSHGFSTALNGYFRRFKNEIITVGRPFAPGFPPPQFDGKNQYTQGGGAIQLTHTGQIFSRRNLLNLGIDYGYNRFSNMISGDFISDSKTREDAVGVYFVDTFDLFESLSVSGGFRYDWDRINFDDKITQAFSFRETFSRVTPKAGVVYNPYRNLGFYFNYSEGFRTPTVTEFQAFGPPPTFTPFVTSLSPVKSRNFELGARWKLPPWLEGTVSLFYTPLRDEILFVVTDPSTFTGRNENISRTLKRGVEVTLTGRYDKWVDGFLNYTATKATFETDILIFAGQVSKGDELPLVPRHRVGFGLNFYPIDGLTLSLFGTYVGTQFLLNDEPNQIKKLDDYFILNSKFSYSWGQWTGFITVNNMTNQKYNTFGVFASNLGVPTPFFVPAPTTTVFAGLKFSYN